MRNYTFDWERMGQDLLETREFTWSAVGFTVLGFSQKWFATCLAEKDFSCAARGYGLPDIMQLFAAGLIAGFFTLGAITAVRVGYGRMMSEYLVMEESEGENAE